MIALLKAFICCHRHNHVGLDEKIVILPKAKDHVEQQVAETPQQNYETQSDSQRQTDKSEHQQLHEKIFKKKALKADLNAKYPHDCDNLAAPNQTGVAQSPLHGHREIDKSEQQRLDEQNRKAEQMYDIFKHEAFEADLNEWRVETHRSSAGNLYSTFHNNTNNFRSLKSVRKAVIGFKQAKQTETCALCRDEVGFKLHCGHWYCQTCLNDYFKLTPPEMILDQLHLLPMCPVCKSLGVVSFLSNQAQAELIRLGILQKAVVQKLDRYAASCAVQDPIYDCIQTNCDERWTLSDMPIRPGTNRYEVTCPKCKCHQCSRCGKSYAQHDKLVCGLKPEDAKTMSYLKTHAVKCPGECGQWLAKEDSDGPFAAMGIAAEEGCNVIKCMKDQLYVCALCGQKLNSSKFDVKDTAHILANEHFSTGPASCHGHLFTNRKEWLKSKDSKLLTISL